MKFIDFTKYNLVLLDWDGTLVYSRDNVIDAMQKTTQKFLDMDWFELDKKRIRSLSLEENFVIFFGCDAQEAYNFYINNYIKTIQKVKKLKSSELLLKKLDSMGLKKAIITNKERTLWEKEKGLFESSFDFSVCRGESLKDKPNPYPILKALDYFSVDKDKVLMIGDTEHDQVSASKAGVLSIIIGKTMDDCTINCLDDLISYSLF